MAAGGWTAVEPRTGETVWFADEGKEKVVDVSGSAHLFCLEGVEVN